MIEWVGSQRLSSEAQVSSTTPPCEDVARATMATFGYDEANRRVYANVAGKETWELRGASGELLAEVSNAGEVERAYVYLDGEPLAMVALNPGKALRSPSTPLGCTSTDAGLPGSMLALLVVLAALSRRRRAKQAAAVAVVLLGVIGCDGTGPQPGPGPTPPPPPGTSPGTIYYFHNDRLGTPVRLTNEVGDTVWRADYRPFGDLERLETDVDGDGVHVEQPLLFAGQYEDALSALILAQGPYYNWNRHYEPATGRYLSPEPMLQRPKWVLAQSLKGAS
ncbi:MAG: RHS domain-containing protein, partial [Rhodoglobus sp.]